MSQYKTHESDPLALVDIRKDSQSHISIKNKNLCLKECANKPCTYFCPSRVYSFENNSLQVNYGRCLECGACPFGCPLHNIYWQYPRGGYGVAYKK